MKNAVHSSASAFQRRGSSCAGGCLCCGLDMPSSVVDVAARIGGLIKTSQHGRPIWTAPELHLQPMLSTYPPSTRSAPPVVADASSEAR